MSVKKKKKRVCFDELTIRAIASLSNTKFKGVDTSHLEIIGNNTIRITFRSGQNIINSISGLVYNPDNNEITDGK